MSCRLRKPWKQHPSGEQAKSWMHPFRRWLVLLRRC